MYAKNHVTGEVIQDIDPKNDNNIYYKLDTRVWDFISEPLQVIGSAKVLIVCFNPYIKHVFFKSLLDLKKVWVSRSGHLCKLP